MGILVALTWALIYIAVILLLAYVVIWAIGELAPKAPPIIPKIVWVIAVLCCVLVIIGTLLPALPGPHYPWPR